MLRLRSALREFFPAALEALCDLDAPDAVELLAAAPDPDRARRLTRRRIAAALRRANRRNVEARATEIQQILAAEQLRRSAPVEADYAAVVASQGSIIATLNTQIEQIATVVEAHFGQHPDAEVYTSQPGLGVILAARVLGEFGDDPHRLRRTSAMGVLLTARLARRQGLLPATARPQHRPPSRPAPARNRLVGILHGCLKTHTPYDEHTARSYHMTSAAWL